MTADHQTTMSPNMAFFKGMRGAVRIMRSMSREADIRSLDGAQAVEIVARAIEDETAKWERKL